MGKLPILGLHGRLRCRDGGHSRMHRKGLPRALREDSRPLIYPHILLPVRHRWMPSSARRSTDSAITVMIKPNHKVYLHVSVPMNLRRLS